MKTNSTISEPQPDSLQHDSVWQGDQSVKKEVRLIRMEPGLENKNPELENKKGGWIVTENKKSFAEQMLLGFLGGNINPLDIGVWSCGRGEFQLSNGKILGFQRSILSSWRKELRLVKNKRDFKFSFLFFSVTLFSRAESIIIW